MSDWYPAGTTDRHIEEAGERLNHDRCPACGSDDISFDGPGYLADQADGQPDTPLMCEDCGATFTLQEATKEPRCEHCGSLNCWDDGSQFNCRDCGEKTETA